MRLQTKWRVAGGVCIAVSAGMAFFGRDAVSPRGSIPFFIGYWLVFLLFFLGAMYCVLLDIRYIRMQYAMGRRELFMQTVGREEFRKALHGEEDAENVESQEPE